MSYLIYRATCEVSGGCYIGITGRQLDVRRREHHRTRTGTQRNCVALHAAIVKHGAESFTWEVLLDGLEQDEAEHLERFLISTTRPRYNIASGGLRGLGFAGSRRSPETIERMRAAARLRGVPASTRAILRERQRKHLVCNETGTIFRDAAEAAMAHGLKRSHVYDLLFKGRVSRTAFVSFRHALPHEIGKANAREA